MKQKISAGTLYITGTPIGNLNDMSPRAVEVLKNADIIAAEDTRHTKKLLSRFGIHTRLISCHKFSERQKATRIIEYILNGMDIALVSSAGMPCISDPGYILVGEAARAGIKVVPVPGPSAFLLAAAVSGMDAGRFMFEGFLPRKKTMRIKRLSSLRDNPHMLIFYEAGNRLENTVKDMLIVFGDRRCAVSRELTKKFEETERGPLSCILDMLLCRKGEFVIIVEGKKEAAVEDINPASVIDEVDRLKKKKGMSSRDAVRRASERLGIPKRKAYELWVKRKKD